jgi:hypothetical protein
MLEHLRDKHGLRTKEAEEDRKRYEHGLPLGKTRNRMAPETAEARMCARYWLEFAELTDDDWAEAKQKERALLARLEEQDARWLAQSVSAAGNDMARMGTRLGTSMGMGMSIGTATEAGKALVRATVSADVGVLAGALEAWVLGEVWGGPGSTKGSGDESSSLSSLSGDE